MEDFYNEEPQEEISKKVGATSEDKYTYVLKYFKDAISEELQQLLKKLTTGKTQNSIEQFIHRARILNKVQGRELDHIKDVPKLLFIELKKFIKNSGSREPMIGLIQLYETHPDSNVISILYRLLPNNYLAYKEGMHGGGTVVKTSEGHKFSINSKCKNWTVSKKYKKWLGKLTRKQKPNKKSEDLCVGSKSICKGDLGIPRKYMPQFDSPAEIQNFTRFVKRVYRIKSFKGTRKARQLKPSQGEINKKRIQGLINDGVLEKVNVPLVVSGDNYVVDGHHRWAAYRLEKPSAALPVMVIDAPIKDVLGIAVAWGAKHQEF
jgi:hypothetical protein